MKRTVLKKICETYTDYVNTEIIVCGWIRSVRASKNLAFISINDGSCYKSVQVIAEDRLENFKEISKLNVGAAITVKVKSFSPQMQSNLLK